MARAGMAGIITFTRALVDDAGSLIWTDDQMQTALDRYRRELRYEQTLAIPTRSASTVTYTTFDTPLESGYLETDAVLYDNTYTAITGTASAPDYVRGRWVFSAEPDRPVYILGWSHDPYSAAADLLEQRLTTLLGAYDVTLGPDSFSRSQMVSNYRAMIKDYRQKSREMGGLTVSRVERSDVYNY